MSLQLFKSRSTPGANNFRWWYRITILLRTFSYCWVYPQLLIHLVKCFFHIFRLWEITLLFKEVFCLNSLSSSPTRSDFSKCWEGKVSPILRTLSFPPPLFFLNYNSHHNQQLCWFLSSCLCLGQSQKLKSCHSVFFLFNLW